MDSEAEDLFGESDSGADDAVHESVAASPLSAAAGLTDEEAREWADVAALPASPLSGSTEVLSQDSHQPVLSFHPLPDPRRRRGRPRNYMVGLLGDQSSQDDSCSARQLVLPAELSLAVTERVPKGIRLALEASTAFDIGEMRIRTRNQVGTGLQALLPAWGALKALVECADMEGDIHVTSDTASSVQLFFGSFRHTASRLAQCDAVEMGVQMLADTHLLSAATGWLLQSRLRYELESLVSTAWDPERLLRYRDQVEYDESPMWTTICPEPKPCFLYHCGGRVQLLLMNLETWWRRACSSLWHRSRLSPRSCRRKRRSSCW